MTQLVTYKVENGIAQIIIDNPPLNVMGQQVQQEIKNSIDMVKLDEEVICVVLTTAGDKAFMAGADIKEFPSMIGNPDMRTDVMAMHDMLNEIGELPKPTIVVLDGLTFGGGCELALTFDIRIAEAHTTIALPEVKLGLFPGGGGTQRLPRLIGASKAKEIMFTGEPISVETAEKIGLVNQVVPTGEGLNAAMNMAAQFTNKSLQSLSRIKKAVDNGREMTLSEGIDREAALFEEVFQTKDVKEGIEAFIGKRKVKFNHQ